MYALSDDERGVQSVNQLELRRQPRADINIARAASPDVTVSVLNFRHASNVVATLSHVQLFALGITRLVIGALCIVFNIVNICFIDKVGWVVYVTGNGFWAGCMCLASGALCIATSRNKTRLMVVGCVLAEMMTSFLALQQLIVGVRGAIWATHLCTYQRLLNEDDTCHVGRVTTAMEASLAALAVVAIAASIWTLIISCKAINCCTEVSVSQFGSSRSSSRDVMSQFAPAAASVAYRQGSTDDVIADRNSRSSYVTLY